MNEIIKQAPEGIDIKIIKEIYEKNNEDQLKTLMELWEIKEKEEIKMENQWDNIRDTCDAFDNEMSKFIKKNTIKL
jgi:DNA-binding transcriptional MerR regulator